jgi:hypothetical protein
MPSACVTAFGLARNSVLVPWVMGTQSIAGTRRKMVEAWRCV